MTFINDDFATKIIKKEIRDRKNKKKLKDIASTPTSSEEYEYTQLSSKKTNILEEEQNAETIFNKTVPKGDRKKRQTFCGVNIDDLQNDNVIMPKSTKLKKVAINTLTSSEDNFQSENLLNKRTKGKKRKKRKRSKEVHVEIHENETFIKDDDEYNDMTFIVQKKAKKEKQKISYNLNKENLKNDTMTTSKCNKATSNSSTCLEVHTKNRYLLNKIENKKRKRDKAKRKKNLKINEENAFIVARDEVKCSVTTRDTIAPIKVKKKKKLKSFCNVSKNDLENDNVDIPNSPEAIKAIVNTSASTEGNLMDGFLLKKHVKRKKNEKNTKATTWNNIAPIKVKKKKKKLFCHASENILEIDDVEMSSGPKKKKRKLSCGFSKNILGIDNGEILNSPKVIKAIANTSTSTEDDLLNEFLLKKHVKMKKKKKKIEVAATRIAVLKDSSEVKEEALLESLEFGTGTPTDNCPINSHVYFNSPSDTEERDIMDHDKAGNAGHPVRSDSSKWNWDRYSRKYVDDNPYACDYCGETFVRSEHLVSHYGTHTGENQYKCHVCGKTFVNDSSLIAHSRAHKGEKTYACNVCSYTSSFKSVFVRHYRTHTGEKPYECDVCSKRFADNSSLIVHYRTHTGEKPYECDVCGKRFAISGNLTVHYRTHTGEKPYECDVCSKRFADNSSLIVHYRTHTGEKPYECDVCGKRFAKSGNLTVHYRTHTGEKPYECDVCSKRFTENSSLTVHYRTHTGEKPYECDVCSKKFTENSSLTVHYRTHTGEKPYECDVCSKRFADNSSLIVHYRTHTGEKPYECDVCGKAFSLKLNMDVHYRTHTDEKPFKCGVCGKRFNQKTHLVIHYRTHTGEKPYECGLCDKSFSSSSTLNRHVKSVHINHL